MAISNASHRGIGNVAASLLFGAILALPLCPWIISMFVPNGDVATIERLVVSLGELLFAGAVLASPHMIIPRLADIRPVTFWLLMGWFLWAGSSVMSSAMPVIALMRQAEWTMHALFLFSVAAFLMNYPAWRKRVPACVAGSLALYAGIALWQFGFSLPQWPVWEDAVQRILTNPWGGIGPGLWAMTPIISGAGEHPGNSVLQLSLAWGIPGALLFFAGITVILWRGWVGQGNRYCVAISLVILLSSLIWGTLYHGVPLLLLAVALGVVLSRDPSFHTGQSGFDINTHGLGLLAAILVLIHINMLQGFVRGETPRSTSMQVYVLKHFPVVMTLESAGERLNGWAAEWRATDPVAAYALLEWNSEHSRTPWTSLRQMGDWMLEDGFENEGRFLLKQATEAEQ